MPWERAVGLVLGAMQAVEGRALARGCLRKRVSSFLVAAGSEGWEGG